jgi:hypothetical protein
MQIKEDDIPDFVRELRGLLGSIKGFQNLTETISLSYVVVVESEEHKEVVVQIANVLTEQAARNCGIDLEITPATQEELAEAAERYKSAMGIQDKPKAKRKKKEI